MAVSRHSVIAKEGWRIIFFSVVVGVILQHFFHHYADFFWSVPLLLLWFYRDPQRQLSSEPLGLLSPVDGEVVMVQAHPDPYLGRDAFLIRVCMSVTNIFSIRSVTEGKIIQQWLDPEDSDNERGLAHAIQIKTDENEDIMIVLRPGRFFKKLNCDAVIGQRIGQGHRCGVIPFGSCVDVYVPENSSIKVAVGDQVKSGVSVLASLKARAQVSQD
jgi:phosphatidylserine decarboxylase